jgi:anti-sigma B factor antagonist
VKIFNDRRGDAVIVRLDGSLDTSTAPDAQTHLDAIANDSPALVVVDLQDVDYLSSAGLRVLLSTAKKLRPHGALRLFGLNPTVRDVFDISGFSMIFPVFDDELAALQG